MDDTRGLEAFPRATLKWQKEENRKSAARTRGRDTLLTAINVRLRKDGPCTFMPSPCAHGTFHAVKGAGKYFVNGACSASHRSDFVATVTVFLSCGQFVINRNHSLQSCT
jgi:hypothetical protein